MSNWRLLSPGVVGVICGSRSCRSSNSIPSPEQCTNHTTALYNIQLVYNIQCFAHYTPLQYMLHYCSNRALQHFPGPSGLLSFCISHEQKCLETVFDKVVAKLHQIMARRTWTWNLGLGGDIEQVVSQMWSCARACQSVARR